VCELGFTGLDKYKQQPVGAYQKLDGWEILTGELEKPEKIVSAIEEATQRLNQSLNGIF